MDRRYPPASARQAKHFPLIPKIGFTLLLWFFSCGVKTAKSQNINPADSIGVPTFTTALPVEQGFIQLGTGDLHLEIPLGSFPQRGGKQLNVSLMYDSNIWGGDSGNYPLNVPTAGLNGPSLLGWRLVAPIYDFGNTFNEVDSNSVCTKDGQPIWSYYQDWFFYEPDGTAHAFPIRTQYYWPTMCNNFNPPAGTPSGAGYAKDASGYYMSVTNYTSAIVYAPDGSRTYGSGEDSNGNQYSHDNNAATLSFGTQHYNISPWNPIDSLGRTVVKTTVNGTNTIYFDVLNSQGGTSRYTVTTETINVNNGIQGSYPAIESITLPDGTSYSFTYDSGTTVGHYGLLKSMTLPTGGTISYTYTYENVPGTAAFYFISSRTTPDSATPWSYTFFNVPNTCQYVSGVGNIDCETQTTVTKPTGDYAVYTFIYNYGLWPIETQYYDASSNLLATIAKNFVSCVNSNVNPCPSTNVLYLTETSETTTLPVPGSSSVSRTTQYLWDHQTAPGYGASVYGNLMSKQEWNFGSNTSGTPDRTTTYTYWSDTHSAYLTANILNRVASETVTNSSGGTVAQTNYCYDFTGGCGGTGFANAGAITSHDANYGTTNTVRGDLTQIQKLASGSTYLTQSKTYDTAGQPLSQTDWTNLSTHTATYSYADKFYTDGGDGSNPNSYNAGTATDAYPTTITYPTVNGVTLTENFGYYWGTGQKALSTDANNNTTYFHFYDSLNRPTSTKLPNSYNGSCCGWTYATYPNGSETQVDNSIGISSTTRSITCTAGLGDCRHDQTLLDVLGRTSSQILISDPDGQTTVATTYDSNGRTYSVSNPHRSTSFPTDGTEYYSYDGLDRKKQITRTDGGIVYISYGALIGSNGRNSQLCSGFGLGYPILYQDEAGRLRQTWTDGFGRLIEVDEPDPSTGSLTSGAYAGTCYGYDLNNNLTGVTQGSQTRSFTYDMLSRLTAATNPESGTINYYYSASGGSPCSGDLSAVCSRTDARSKTTTYAYDALNRLISKSYSDSTPSVAYGYDAVAPTGCTPPSLTITNGKGRRTSMCDGPGATAWSYDQVGNAQTEKRTTNSVTNSFLYTYNLDSTVATLGYPSGRTITYQSGGAQRPLWALDTTNSISYAWGPCTNSTSTTGACYLPPGELAGLNNGASIHFTALTNKRLQPCWAYATTGTALSWNSTTCTTTETTAGNILDLEYSLNLGSSDNGNILGITNNRDTTRSETATYDFLNRIATAAASTHAVSPTHCWGESYAIDRYGNLTTIGSISSAYNGCSQDSLSLAVSTTTNRITTSGFTYDSAGNLTSDGTHSPQYDAENRMISDAGVTYSYDADGKRVLKNSGTLYWYGTSSAPLLETNASGTLVDEYIFFEGKRISRRDSSGNVEYYFADQIGSARVVTNASGAILEDCDYFPYGGSGCSPSNINNYLFTGKERDSESGLDNFGARYMSSQYGRFMSADPFTVTPGRVVDPQQLNLYAYVRNNPLRHIDPTGMIIDDAACLADKKHCGNDWQKVQNVANQQDSNGNYLHPELHNILSTLQSDSRTFVLENSRMAAGIAGLTTITDFTADGKDFTRATLQLDFRQIKGISGVTAADLVPGFNKYQGLLNAPIDRLAETFGHEGAHGLFAIQNPAQAVEIQQLINDRNSAMHGVHFPYPPDVMQRIDAADRGLIPTERFAQQEEKIVNGELQADKKKQ